MFVSVFWMDRNLPDTWLMMGLEVLVGIVVYVAMVLLLKAPIVGEVRSLVKQRFGARKA